MTLTHSDDRIKVLLADDEPTLLSLLSKLLEEQDDYSLELATNGQEALKKFQEQDPDLLITDLKMPRLSGEDLTRKALCSRPDLTVLVITGNGSINSAVRLMKDGVFDYITKPFQLSQFSSTVERATRKIRSAPMIEDRLGVITALMNALEAKDPYLKNHSQRVAKLAYGLSVAMGIPARRAATIRRAGLVHDLGKIGVSETILNKAGRLSPEEFSAIRKHPIHSVRILEPLVEFRACIPDVYHHHEWFDGSGYPGGISGHDIPIGARIICVCDAYDAMASDRSYRAALPEEVIWRKLVENSGIQFDGDVVEAFLKVFTR